MPPSQLTGAASTRGHGPAPSLLNLPNKMLLEIANKLEGDNAPLSALMKTCKHLKPIAEGVLY